jgi:hypothetical protein
LGAGAKGDTRYDARRVVKILISGLAKPITT